MSDVEILYVCSGADKCDRLECYHKKPHTHTAGCESSCCGGVFGATCSGLILNLNLKMEKEQAQELLNVISMAAGEGVEYDFTENLVKKLGKFIDGGV